MKTLNKILMVLGAVLLILATFFITDHIKEKKLEKQRLELRKQILKNDSLVQINEGLYTKRIADTLKISQLRKLNNILQLELEDPKVIVVTKVQPKDQEKEVDSIIVKDNLVSIKDYYPDKENPFITYSADVNFETQKGEGKFSFKELNLNFGVTQNKDGTYSLNSSVPDFINVTDITVQSLPLTPKKVDNFGWLAGAGIGQDFRDQSQYLTLNAGIRFRKLYLEVQGSTNNTLSTNIKFEF